ncbi:hypothetical protein BGZ46_008419 [Entomortierella lignicola]|nr:hypothetical protein BGZ46_008419 [Entomortierella lignicola]
MSTDKDLFISSELQDRTDSTNTIERVIPIKRSRLVRSPTPHTLSDHLSSDISEDSQNTHSTSSSVVTSSSAPTNISNQRIISANDTNITQVGDAYTRPIQCEKLSLFETIARRTPEDIELARVTKANTVANSLIGKPNPSSPPRTTPSLPSTQSLKRKSSAHQHDDNPPTSPQYLADVESESDSEDGSELVTLPLSDSHIPLPLPPHQLPRKKRRTSDSDNIVAVSDASIEDPQKLGTSSSQSMVTPESSARPNRKKSVWFDETKNSVFDYKRGSTIVLSFSDNSAIESNSDNDEDDDDDNEDDDDYDNKYEASQYDFQYGNSSLNTASNLLATSRWWSWSSFAPSGTSNRPILSDTEALPPSQLQDTSNSSSLPSMTMAMESIFRSQESLSQESLSQEDSSQGLSQEEQVNLQGLFMNIASSLDRIWTPSGLGRSFSSLSSASSSSNISVDQDTSLILFTSQPSSSLEAAESSSQEAPLLNDDSSRDVESRNTPQSQASVLKSDGKEQVVEATTLEEMDGEDTVMKEFLFDSLSPPNFDNLVGSQSKESRSDLHLQSLASSGSPSISPSPLPGHPSRAPIPNSSFKPPSLSRAASFSAKSSNQKALPTMLRREASTTALLDALL